MHKIPTDCCFNRTLLQSEMNKRGLNNSKIAQAIDKSQSTISRLVSGAIRNPDFCVVVSIAKFFGLKAEDFMIKK